METLVQFTDVKPGDSGEITFSLHLCDNPGYIWMQAGNVSDEGGAFTEPKKTSLPARTPPTSRTPSTRSSGTTRTATTFTTTRDRSTSCSRSTSRGRCCTTSTAAW